MIAGPKTFIWTKNEMPMRQVTPVSANFSRISSASLMPLAVSSRSIRDGIEPRLVGVAIQAVRTGPENKVVIAIGVPQSINRPHRVNAVGSARWTTRRNRDTIDMTYAELRSAFIDAANIETRSRISSRTISGCSDLSVGNGILLIHVISLAVDDRTLDVHRALQEHSKFFPPTFQLDQCPGLVSGL
jgi:hypothetical protein